MVKKVQKDLEERDSQLMQLKHQEAVLLSQKALGESGQGSFVENKTLEQDIFATPSPDKRNRKGSEDAKVYEY